MVLVDLFHSRFFSFKLHLLFSSNQERDPLIDGDNKGGKDTIVSVGNGKNGNNHANVSMLAWPKTAAAGSAVNNAIMLSDANAECSTWAESHTIVPGR